MWARQTLKIWRVDASWALPKAALKSFTKKIRTSYLGVHVVGVNASELIHFGMLLAEEKLTIERIISMVFNFPTLYC